MMIVNFNEGHSTPARFSMWGFSPNSPPPWIRPLMRIGVKTNYSIVTSMKHGTEYFSLNLFIFPFNNLI